MNQFLIKILKARKIFGSIITNFNRLILPDKKYILIALISLMIALGPLTARTTHAISIFSGFKDIIAYLANIVLWLVSWVLWLTANLFDLTLKLTLKNSTFANISAVNLGWEIVRDVVNLFFIFILLYIAIGAILRLAGHDTKKLLVNLIIAALLINFSMPITKAIIDASNILALEFYDKISWEKDGVKVGVTQTIMNGLRLTSIYGKEVLENPLNTPNPEEATLSNIILSALGGSALILVTAFVFLAATFLFVARTIVLLFLIILSPLAFGAMILPNTKKYADRWWQELGCQCLLAPAFMFMIYLVVMIIKDGSFSSAFSGIDADNTATMAEAFTKGLEGSMGVILNFVLLIGLMIGSLIISKNMACAGGSQALAAAGWARGKVQGYAKTYAKRGAGWVAEREMEKEQKDKDEGRKGFWAATRRVIRKTPGMGRGLAALSAGREQELAAKRKQYEKQYKDYSDTGLQTMLKTPAITSEKRKAIEKISEDRKNKKDTETAEKAEYKEIVDEKDKTTGKVIKKGKLTKINEEINKITGGINKDIGDYLDGIEAQLENLRGKTLTDAQQTERNNLIHQRGKTNRLMKEKEKLEARREKLEEKQQSKTEEKKLKERMEKIETRSEEKPKEIT